MCCKFLLKYIVTSCAVLKIKIMKNVNQEAFSTCTSECGYLLIEKISKIFLRLLVVSSDIDIAQHMKYIIYL